MTRFSFLLFNILLTVAIYALTWFGGGRESAITYTLAYFSAPYIGLLMLMAILTTIRFFLSPNEDIIKGAVTYWHAAWITGLLTFAAIKLISGGMHFTIFKNLSHLLGGH